MKHLAALVVAAVLVVYPLVGLAAAPPNKVFEAVYPVQEVIDGELDTLCTSTLIDKERKLVLTAAHCIRGEALAIGGTPGFVIDFNEPLDMAVIFVPALGLQPDLSHKKLKDLALGKAPKVGDQVFMVGYPSGVPFQMLSQGWISALNAFEEFTAYQLFRYGGYSGSAVVNEKGDVVSVHQVTLWDPVGGGARYEDLVAFAGPYFRVRK